MLGAGMPQDGMFSIISHIIRILAANHGFRYVYHMESALKKLMAVMPFLFGVGFIAPLLAQLMISFEIAPPLGMQPLVFGLIVGGGWGLIANIRGRWL